VPEALRGHAAPQRREGALQVVHVQLMQPHEYLRVRVCVGFWDAKTVGTGVPGMLGGTHTRTSHTHVHTHTPLAGRRRAPARPPSAPR
jgi:hypothetical protein